MKKTKDIILDTALRLFNTKGLSQITLRAIAIDMGISQGNLNYHYKKREDIVESLYFQLVDNINESFTQAHIGQANDKLVHALLNIAEKAMLNFYEYRFVMIDFVKIIRENEKIRVHFRQLTELREQQLFNLLNVMIEQDLLRLPLLENEYENLCNRIKIITEFWIPHAIITTDSECVKADVINYSTILSQTIYPYLTDKGRAEYYSYVSILQP